MTKKVVSIQDLSCYGQCSSTVALPIMSALGVETIVLPTSLLSNHTMFKKFTFFDLEKEIKNIISCWEENELKFDAVYTGYLGKASHVDLVLEVLEKCTKDKYFIMDPAFGDSGKLYPGFDVNYVNEMKRLVKSADCILPNITEACYLLGEEVKLDYDEAYLKDIMKRLYEMGAKNVIITGANFNGQYGVSLYDGKNYSYYFHQHIKCQFHGTGDIFSSCFVSKRLYGNSIEDSVKFAANFVVKCIKATEGAEDHKYGVKFEEVLHNMIKDEK